MLLGWFCSMCWWLPKVTCKFNYTKAYSANLEELENKSFDMERLLCIDGHFWTTVSQEDDVWWLLVSIACQDSNVSYVPMRFANHTNRTWNDSKTKKETADMEPHPASLELKSIKGACHPKRPYVQRRVLQKTAGAPPESRLLSNQTILSSIP